MFRQKSCVVTRRIAYNIYSIWWVYFAFARRIHFRIFSPPLHSFRARYIIRGYVGHNTTTTHSHISHDTKTRRFFLQTQRQPICRKSFPPAVYFPEPCGPTIKGARISLRYRLTRKTLFANSNNSPFIHNTYVEWSPHSNASFSHLMCRVVLKSHSTLGRATIYHMLFPHPVFVFDTYAVVCKGRRGNSAHKYCSYLVTLSMCKIIRVYTFKITCPNDIVSSIFIGFFKKR